MLAFPASASAAGRVFPIQEFEEVRERWVGLETTVEGRRTVYDPVVIRLKNSSITFKPQGVLPKLIRKNANLRLTGTLEKTDGRWVFQVKSVEEAPSDLDQYLAREREVKKTDPAQWYALADWVAGRGKFYDDSTLLDKARECRRKGFDIERSQLPEGDHQARTELANRSADLGIPDAIRQELVHESFVIRRKALAKQPEQVAEDQLMTDIEEDLPGATKPLASENADLRKRYQIDPLTVYAATKVAERPLLHRMLWSGLELARIERTLAADSQNGFEVAAKIDERVPEFHAKAEAHREKVLELRAANVQNMTRSEILKLRQDYRDRQQPELGEVVVESWLQWKKKRLKDDDIEGLINLAEQYEEILKQPQSKVRLLLEAVAKHPNSPELAERLTKLGYRRNGEKWITESEFRAIPQGRLEQALQEGRVEVGMTARQVQKSLGVPATTTRVVARGIVNEIWTYQSPGSAQPLMIYLLRRLPANESTVVGVDQPP